jgi:hypothetical protein
MSINVDLDSILSELGGFDPNAAVSANPLPFIDGTYEMQVKLNPRPAPKEGSTRTNQIWSSDFSTSVDYTGESVVPSSEEKDGPDGQKVKVFKTDDHGRQQYSVYVRAQLIDGDRKSRPFDLYLYTSGDKNRVPLAYRFAQALGYSDQTIRQELHRRMTADGLTVAAALAYWVRDLIEQAGEYASVQAKIQTQLEFRDRKGNEKAIARGHENIEKMGFWSGEPSTYKEREVQVTYRVQDLAFSPAA